MFRSGIEWPLDVDPATAPPALRLLYGLTVLVDIQVRMTAAGQARPEGQDALAGGVLQWVPVISDYVWDHPEYLDTCDAEIPYVWLKCAYLDPLVLMTSSSLGRLTSPRAPSCRQDRAVAARLLGSAAAGLGCRDEVTASRVIDTSTHDCAIRPSPSSS